MIPTEILIVTQIVTNVYTKAVMNATLHSGETEIRQMSKKTII